MQTISNKAVKKMTGNQRLIGRFMVLFNKSSKTIERWIEDRDIRFTTPQAVIIIKEETGLTDSQILEGNGVAA